MDGLLSVVVADDEDDGESVGFEMAFDADYAGLQDQAGSIRRCCCNHCYYLKRGIFYNLIYVFYFLEFDLEALVHSFTHIHIEKAQIIDGPRLIELGWDGTAGRDGKRIAAIIVFFCVRLLVSAFHCVVVVMCVCVRSANGR